MRLFLISNLIWYWYMGKWLTFSPWPWILQLWYNHLLIPGVVFCLFVLSKKFFFYINSHVICEQVSLFLPSQFFSPHSSFSLFPSVSSPSPPFAPPFSLSFFIVLEYLYLVPDRYKWERFEFLTIQYDVSCAFL